MTLRTIVIACLGGLVMAATSHSAPAEPDGHITGVGGVFIKAKDWEPKRTPPP